MPLAANTLAALLLAVVAFLAGRLAPVQQAVPARVQLATETRSDRQHRFLSERPRIIFFPDFLSYDETEELIRLAKPHLAPAQVGHTLGDGERDEVRTSSSYYLKKREQYASAHVLAIKQRAALASRLPIELQEDVQVQNYKLTQKYGTHLDTLESWPSRRIATFIMYLTDVEEGGETYFPFADAGSSDHSADAVFNHSHSFAELSHTATLGSVEQTDQFCGAQAPRRGVLRVKPKRGDAVLFFSLMPDGRVDPRSLHGSCPVVRGEKWISQIWINEWLESPAFSDDCIGFYHLDGAALDDLAGFGGALRATSLDGSTPAPASAVSRGAKLQPPKAPTSTRLAANTQLVNSAYPALSLIADTSSFTISVWVFLHAAATSGEQTLMRLSFPSSDPASSALTWRVFVARDQTLQLSLTGGNQTTASAQTVSSATTLAPSMWHLVALVARPSFPRGKFQPFSRTWPIAASLLHAAQGADKVDAVGGSERRSTVALDGAGSFDWLKGSLAIGGGGVTMDALGLTILTRALTPKEWPALLNSYSPIGA